MFMDTIIIIRDSVATCVNKMATICQPCVKEPDTNWQDVIIWVTLFVAFAYVVRYGIKQYFIWKKAERAANDDITKAKREQEKNDRDWKQKSDLMDKLLDLQKNYAEIKRDEHGNQVKRYDDSAFVKYEKTLKTLVDDEKLRTNDDNKNNG